MPVNASETVQRRECLRDQHEIVRHAAGTGSTLKPRNHNSSAFSLCTPATVPHVGCTGTVRRQAGRPQPSGISQLGVFRLAAYPYVHLPAIENPRGYHHTPLRLTVLVLLATCTANGSANTLQAARLVTRPCTLAANTCVTQHRFGWRRWAGSSQQCGKVLSAPHMNYGRREEGTTFRRDAAITQFTSG